MTRMDRVPLRLRALSSRSASSNRIEQALFPTPMRPHASHTTPDLTIPPRTVQRWHLVVLNRPPAGTRWQPQAAGLTSHEARHPNLPTHLTPQPARATSYEVAGTQYGAQAESEGR